MQSASPLKVEDSIVPRIIAFLTPMAIRLDFYLGLSIVSRGLMHTSNWESEGPMREHLRRISSDLRTHVQSCLTHWPFVSYRQLAHDVAMDEDGIHVHFEISQPRLRQAMRIAAVNRAWHNHTVPGLLGQAVIDPLLVVYLLSSRRQTGTVTVEKGQEVMLLPISMAYRLPVQVIQPPMARPEHHDNRRVPRPQSDDVILNGLRFDHYELTLGDVFLPSDYPHLAAQARRG